MKFMSFSLLAQRIFFRRARNYMLNFTPINITNECRLRMPFLFTHFILNKKVPEVSKCNDYISSKNS